MTSRRPAESIRLHHEMVRHAAEEIGHEFGIPCERSFLCGLSQSVGPNYRFVATYTDLFRGVIAICAGLPGDCDDGNYREVAASVLHIAWRSDEYYPPEVTCGYAQRLGQALGRRRVSSDRRRSPDAVRWTENPRTVDQADCRIGMRSTSASGFRTANSVS
jgi:poly(3-hydroxybutyrate) depolymerase